MSASAASGPAMGAWQRRHFAWMASAFDGVAAISADTCARQRGSRAAFAIIDDDQRSKGATERSSWSRMASARGLASWQSAQADDVVNVSPADRAGRREGSFLLGRPRLEAAGPRCSRRRAGARGRARLAASPSPQSGRPGYRGAPRDADDDHVRNACGPAHTRGTRRADPKTGCLGATVRPGAAGDAAPRARARRARRAPAWRAPALDWAGGE